MRRSAVHKCAATAHNYSFCMPPPPPDTTCDTMATITSSFKRSGVTGKSDSVKRPCEGHSELPCEDNSVKRSREGNSELPCRDGDSELPRESDSDCELPCESDSELPHHEGDSEIPHESDSELLGRPRRELEGDSKLPLDSDSDRERFLAVSRTSLGQWSIIEHIVKDVVYQRTFWYTSISHSLK